MQGYILHIVKVRDEDLLVTLLTENSLKTLYRFYGARHANIHLGFKIDFEIRSSPKTTISQLRHVLHLGVPWIADRERFYHWQQFLTLLYRHLRDVDDLDSFYFTLLDETSGCMERQNPRRCIIEAYIRLLRHEGRLHEDFVCFLCNAPITEELVLARGYLPAHRHCLYHTPLPIDRIAQLFEEGHTLFLSDAQIDTLWQILLEGL